ncbi:hypothetical protein D3C71_1845170 [compost metagenome]
MYRIRAPNTLRSWTSSVWLWVTTFVALTFLHLPSYLVIATTGFASTPSYCRGCSTRKGSCTHSKGGGTS